MFASKKLVLSKLLIYVAIDIKIKLMVQSKLNWSDICYLKLRNLKKYALQFRVYRIPNMFHATTFTVFKILLSSFKKLVQMLHKIRLQTTVILRKKRNFAINARPQEDSRPQCCTPINSTGYFSTVALSVLSLTRPRLTV